MQLLKVQLSIKFITSLFYHANIILVSNYEVSIVYLRHSQSDIGLSDHMIRFSFGTRKSGCTPVAFFGCHHHGRTLCYHLGCGTVVAISPAPFLLFSITHHHGRLLSYYWKLVAKI